MNKFTQQLQWLIRKKKRIRSITWVLATTTDRIQWRKANSIIKQRIKNQVVKLVLQDNRPKTNQLNNNMKTTLKWRKSLAMKELEILEMLKGQAQSKKIFSLMSKTSNPNQKDSKLMV